MLYPMVKEAERYTQQSIMLILIHMILGFGEWEFLPGVGHNRLSYD